MLHKEREWKSTSEWPKPTAKFKQTPAVKSADSTGMEIVAMRVRGFSDLFNGGQGRINGNRVEESEMHRGGNQVGGMNAQPANGRVSAVSAREIDQATDVVTSTFAIHSMAVNVLFDLGATCSFLAKSKVKALNLGTFENVSYTVAVPSGKKKLYSCDRLYKDVPLKIEKVVFPSDLYLLDMEGLKVILGMDWLGKYKATIEFRKRRVSLEGPRGEKVRYRKFQKGPKTNLVSTLEL